MILKTTRLTLRPQHEDDAACLFAILNDVQAMRFWSRPPIKRLAVVEELIQEQQVAMASGVCRYWTVLEGGDAIGSVDLSLIRQGSAELGFLFRRDRWGLGLASEAVGAVSAHAIGPIGLTRLASAVQMENKAASRVLEKNGFLLVDRRNVTIAGGQLRDCGFYLLGRNR
jgi:[ribosomal protein S5]-alanine N-acetyltransferase